MRLGIKPLSEERGITFFKLLGCGGGNGFSIIPDFSTYALLCVWKNGNSRNTFEESNPLFQAYTNKISEGLRHDLHPVHGHGTWGGKEPFFYQTALDMETPWAVITRASIRTSRLIEFWRKVPRVSKIANGFPGSEFSIGIGELPLVEQATFSIWKDPEKIKFFAYKDAAHAEVVKLTRERNWYSEELFVRFQVIRSVSLN